MTKNLHHITGAKIEFSTEPVVYVDKKTFVDILRHQSNYGMRYKIVGMEKYTIYESSNGSFVDFLSSNDIASAYCLFGLGLIIEWERGLFSEDEAGSCEVSA